MINNYGFFNDHENNNTLRILFSDEPVTSVKNENEVSLLLNDNKIVGYLIPDFIRFAKIKYSGIIFLPNNVLIDVVNSVLANSGYETLAYKTNSGYVIKKNGDKYGVYALAGTFLKDESISNGKFCTYDELFIEHDDPNSLVEIDENNLEGKDFFLNKEKTV